MPAAVHTATLGTLTLKQILSSSFSFNGTPVELNASGAVDVSQFLAGPGEYRIGFETDDLAGVAAVSNFATAGLAVSAGTITIPYQLRANLGTFASGANHVSFSATHGLIWPETFSLPAGGDATASLTCLPISSDGDTDPVTPNVSVSLSAETPNAKYTLGPVTTNGTEVSDVTGVTITTGIEVSPLMLRFNYPVYAFIVRRRPVIEITTYDVSAASGSWVAGTALEVFARKRSATGFVADATAEHVKFSFADGLYLPAASVTGAGVGGHSVKTIRCFGEVLTVAGSSALS